MQFKDKKDRNIRLENNYGTIFGYNIDKDNEEVGSIQFKIDEYEMKYMESKKVAYPYIANIKAEYQRSGIATKMIEYALILYGDVRFAPNGIGSAFSDVIHYTDDGLGFKNYCENKGITKEIINF